MQTQWRQGAAGPTGLDYAGVRVYLQSAVPPEQRKQVFEGIRAAELGTLHGWSDKKKAAG